MANKLNEEATREVLKKLLAQCTEAQRKFFDRLYGSIDKIPYEKMDHAITQAQRSVEKNIKKGE